LLGFFCFNIFDPFRCFNISATSNNKICKILYVGFDWMMKWCGVA
jgi:hypothetical protein